MPYIVPETRVYIRSDGRTAIQWKQGSEIPLHVAVEFGMSGAQEQLDELNKANAPDDTIQLSELMAILDSLPARYAEEDEE